MWHWLFENYLEIIGAVSGLIYLYFSVNQNIWLWPVGLITSGFYAIVFYYSQLYADMSLNVYYLLVSIYGWYHWLTRKDNVHHDSIKIVILSIKQWLVLLAVVFILTIGFSWILIHIPVEIGLKPSAVPYWDAFLTAGSIVATWMLAQKYLEQWLWWMVIDSISVGVFCYKGLYLTVILFIVNALMAVIGYIKWKKEFRLQ